MQPPTFSIDKPPESKSSLQAGLRSLWRYLFRVKQRREAAPHLPPHFLRDIGLHERRVPDWERDLR